LNRRRAKIGEMTAKGSDSISKSEVPLSEMFGYVNNLRSRSEGRAAYSMEPSHFEEVPANIVAQITEQK